MTKFIGGVVVFTVWLLCAVTVALAVYKGIVWAWS